MLEVSYLGKDLYDKVNQLVENAFYKIYRRGPEVYYRVDSISLDFNTCENEVDKPLITVNITCYTKVEGTYSVELDYFLDESDDFNVGSFYTSIVNAD